MRHQNATIPVAERGGGSVGTGGVFAAENQSEVTEMKINMKSSPVMTLTEFADKNGLEMDIVERGIFPGVSRYYAQFKDCEVTDGSFLIGAFGNGDTPEEAMLAYIPEISQKVLALRAFKGGDSERDINVPILTGIE